MDPSRPRDDELSERASGLVDLARRSLGEMSERQRLTGLHELRKRLHDRHRAWRMRWTALAATGAGAGVLVLVMAARRHERGGPQLTLHVEGAELRSDGSIEGPEGARPVMHFSDGSEVSLAEGARAHVRAIQEQGARVTLDDGRVHVYVAHGHDTHWAFEAGPFVVTVTGTAFGLSWSESTRRLDVRLENGAVTVTGPASDTPLSLRAGQWLTVRGSDVLIRPLSFEDADATAKTSVADLVSDAAIPSASPATHGSDSRGRAAEPDVPKRSWANALASGQFDVIVNEALAMGLPKVFGKSSSDDLAALADAARYTRREDVARGALLAQRQRFPGSEYGRVAAFYLGRMAEGDHDERSALSWFEGYLAESPHGTFASEALGRRMILVRSIQGSPAARPLAEAYLQRFPEGTYAETARALTTAP